MLWFVVGWAKALVPLSRMNTVVYVLWTVGA
jgi:hypothetical protein